MRSSNQPRHFSGPCATRRSFRRINISSYLNGESPNPAALSITITQSSLLGVLAQSSLLGHEQILYNKSVDFYVALVLSILLHGSESRSLRADLPQRLGSFHNRNCRSMCRFAIAHILQHHIKSAPSTPASASSPSVASTSTDSSNGEGTSFSCLWAV
jgi:hypothetical protein